MEDACGCNPLGSSILVCNYTTGQCPCRANVAKANQLNVLGLIDDYQCRSCMSEFFGFYTGQGCTHCGCHPTGSTGAQCDDYGICTCIPTVNGPNCDTCADGYFLFTSTGCSQCNCSTAGSTGVTCDIATGACTCKENAAGPKCDGCAADSFNLDIRNPKGCQKCFCYEHATSCTSAEGFAAHTLTATYSDWGQTPDGSYFIVPGLLSGQRVSSYNQMLSVEVRAQGILPLSFAGYRPVILQGDGKEMFYKADNFTATFTYSTLKMTLREDLWFKMEAPLENYDWSNFYRILANLTGIRVQRRYTEQLIDLYNVSLVTHRVASVNDHQVGFVENCSCTVTGVQVDNVGEFRVTRREKGLSCENCAQGYFRFNPNDDAYTACKMCNCSGRAETSPAVCDPATGECLNCRNGSVGFNCESCAPNIMLTLANDCQTCMDGYWGLSKNGCVPCECNVVGTIQGSICDKVSGQCRCVSSTVVGRTCNECADNYYGLTSIGCSVCNECYQLVGVEINVLREMRYNLTELVDLLHQDDMNDELGPFSARLARTQANTRVLLNFLNDFNVLKTTAVGEIDRLNSTLLFLINELDVTIKLGLDRVNISVLAADVNATEGFVVNHDTLITTRLANTMLWGGNIPLYSTVMENLVDSLKSIEYALTDVSDSSLQDVLRVTQLVGGIERDSNTALTTAQSQLTTVQSLEATHIRNRQDAAQLQNDINRVSAIQTITTSNADAALATATKAQSNATTAYTNASTIGSIGVDVPALSFKASQLRDRAQRLNTQTLQATVGAQTTISRVKTAQAETATLKTRVSGVNTNANSLLERMSLAQSSALNASALANTTVEAATNMLDTMQNFEQKVTDVKAAAASSRAQLNTIEAQAQKVITDAVVLGDQLSKAEKTAKDSVTVAQQGKNITEANLEAMKQVNEKSQQLVQTSVGVLNDVDAKYGQILNLNATSVNSARNILKNVAGSVSALETKTSSATVKASNATKNTKTTKDRIAKVLEKFKNIGDINSNDILELQLLVQKARQDFDSRDLEDIVSRYRDSVEQNRQKIAAMTQKVQNLQLQVSRLRKVADKLGGG